MAVHCLQTHIYACAYTVHAHAQMCIHDAGCYVGSWLLCTADDYAKVIQEALTLAASEMRITEDEVLAEWELQVRHYFLT